MAEQSLTWTGDAVTKKLRQAQIHGVNRTMAASVQHAKSNHEWQNRTGVLEGGIDIVDYAVEVPEGVRGVWGVQDVVYALAQELGATIFPVKAQALKIPQPDGSFRFVKKVTLKAKPYLRPAADVQYPNLADNIRKAYEKLDAAEAAATASSSGSEGGSDG